ncbi:hypothetical protein CDL12_30330 [Handroanthus impetiginosus]|uniref:Amino acid transporter transmembrane domain-containing protein n=1 Tax=Handroanthus impetiginosus TaxID=429701 RepID=A0A2G9FVW4_9LAMI|nr:hypothetical protein CDL12_30330 [Handroanthus impetiginosus]
MLEISSRTRSTMGVTKSDHHLPLLLPVAHSDDSAKRTGTIWTAVAHIITGVIGSGVLSLAWSMAQLGWIAGPFSMLFFAAITLASTFLVCDSYRFPDPDTGPIRNRSYPDAVRLNLGDRSAQICGVFMQLNFYGTGIAYVITSATCLSGSDADTILTRDLGLNIKLSL